VTAAGSPRLELLLIPPDVATAAALARCDVDRAFVDLEVIGKRERQAHVAAHFSHHTLADLPAYRDATVGVELLVRTNPIHDGTEEELAAVLAAAPDVVMLPMVRHPREVERFVRRVGGRARVSLLVETPQAFVRLAELLDAGGVDEVHIGLNDLHLAMGLDFMFEVVTSGFLEVLAGVCAERGVRFGVGGVARVDEGAVPGRLVLGEHVRLGSEAVILSRTFTRRAASSEVVDPEELAAEVARLRAAEAGWRGASPEELLRNREELRRRVRQVAFGERVTPA
jgi:hypothetical protein